MTENYKTISEIFRDTDNLEVTDYTAGFSNYTPDGNYVVGKVCNGLYFGGGDCGMGVSSSGGIGKMIAIKHFIDRFCPSRFKSLSRESFISATVDARANKKTYK